MSNGNAHQSSWSAEFHAARGQVSAPCPAAEFGGCGGVCAEVHPRGIVLLAAGGWKVVPPSEPAPTLFVEHYV